MSVALIAVVAVLVVLVLLLALSVGVARVYKRGAIFRLGLPFFSSDSDLKQEIPSPEKQRSFGEILLETIAFPEHYLGRASSIYQTITSKTPPRL